MSGPTPGPWERYEATGLGDMTYTFVRSVSTGQDIASIFPDDQLESNGALIEAAPDMKKALEAYLKDFNCDSADCRMKSCILARTALAKARGES